MNGADSSGVDTSILTVSNVNTGDAGNYYVMASNCANTVTSSNGTLTVTSPTTTNTLSVASSNPSSGVSITVTPNDTGGNGNAGTPFTRTYTNNTTVTLTAPSTYVGNNFQQWQQNGVEYTTSPTATVTMNNNYTMTAVYVTPTTTYTLTVASSNPGSGVSITANPTDNNGKGGGSTSFALTYNSSTVVTLTAPSTASGNNFQSWLQDGITWTNTMATTLTMGANHTMTAVYQTPGPTRIIDLVPQSNLAFGNVQVNTVASRVVIIVNDGNTNLDISSIIYPVGFSGNWSGTILAHNQAAIAVNFSPTTLGSYGGTMTVKSDATSGSNTLPISGTGVIPPPPSTNRIPVTAFETLHQFDDSDGNNPYGSLVQGSDGGFYETTFLGGSTPSGTLSGWGTIFRIASDGTFISLYSFLQSNSSTDGTQPFAGLVQGTDGNFYGTTREGGAIGDGTIFSITSYGTLATLFSFNAASGVGPWNLVEGSDGNFYGTSQSGGTGYGNIFRITPNGTFTNLYSFQGSDGSLPGAGLVSGSDGSFYGTTSYGGTNGGNGTIFKIAPDGTFTSLLSFSGVNGTYPSASLVEGSDSNFYGTASGGGAWGNGTVFRITPGGALTTLYSFTGGSDGYWPVGALMQATDGNFYGTTSAGGTNGVYARYGTIFQITPTGRFTTLHLFQAGSEGRNPQAGMVRGQDGNLYGTTVNGGTNDQGTVFRLVIPPTLQAVTLTGGTIMITWGAVPNQAYQLQHITDMTQTNWMSSISSITATSATMTVSNVIGSVTQQFYRILMMPEAW